MAHAHFHSWFVYAYASYPLSTEDERMPRRHADQERNLRPEAFRRRQGALITHTSDCHARGLSPLTQEQQVDKRASMRPPVSKTLNMHRPAPT